MAKVTYSLVMPERELASGEADMVIVPGGDGDFGVLPGHIPMISTVRPGIVEIQDGGKTTARYVVAGGFAEVTRERCTILAEEATPIADVSADQLAERERAAVAALQGASGETERKAAESALGVARDLRRAYDFHAAR